MRKATEQNFPVVLVSAVLFTKRHKSVESVDEHYISPPSTVPHFPVVLLIDSNILSPWRKSHASECDTIQMKANELSSIFLWCCFHQVALPFECMGG